MLARNKAPDISDYVSDRVFDGSRRLTANRAAKLRANYNRTHTTKVFRLVAHVRQYIVSLVPHRN